MRPAQSRYPSFSIVAAWLIALLVASGCGTSASTSTNLDSRLVGVWLIDGGATYTITASEGAYELAIVDFDDEVFQVRSVTWNEGVLAWTYYVPSSGASVSEETTLISENRLEVQWENSDGDTGIDVLNRIR